MNQSSVKDIPQISIVVPVLNEEQVLPLLLERLQASLGRFGGAYQIVFVDDGSTDRTREQLLRAAQDNSRLGVIFLSRNFGHQSAISAGLAFATGRVVAVMDADLQDPPELLPALFDRINEGNDIVYAVRRRRQGNPIKRLCYWVFYRILGFLSRYPIPPDAGDFCAMTGRVVKLLNAMPERDRFLRGLRAWVGFKQSALEYDRDRRLAGETKYSLSRLVRLAFDGILSASDKPLRVASVAGLAVSIGSLLFALYTIFWRLFLGEVRLPGYASVAAGLFFIGGIQLISLGILGEYIGRIFNQVKGRPMYVIDQTQNLPIDPTGV